ncbi:MAG: hypothetical protein K9M54_13870 [Kiritimatiellales bacterium]|nr:hypothetical protein [Kiritimatiellales bacterium]MCF7864644.1 hypothetical protein [Kiritimatiellales bacterium]
MDIFNRLATKWQRFSQTLENVTGNPVLPVPTEGGTITKDGSLLDDMMQRLDGAMKFTGFSGEDAFRVGTP